VSRELREWIESHAGDRRLQPKSPLFPNPNTGNPYNAHRLREIWITACDAAEVEYAPLYRAMERLEELEQAAAGRQAGDKATIATIGPKARDFGD